MKGKVAETCRKASEHFKSLAVGASVAAVNLGLAAQTAQHCTGSCQNCGGLCAIPMLGVAASGIIAYIVKRPGKKRKSPFKQNGTGGK
jgi:hypothetical protein